MTHIAWGGSVLQDEDFRSQRINSVYRTLKALSQKNWLWFWWHVYRLQGIVISKTWWLFLNFFYVDHIYLPALTRMSSHQGNCRTWENPVDIPASKLSFGLNCNWFSTLYIIFRTSSTFSSFRSWAVTFPFKYFASGVSTNTSLYNSLQNSSVQ